MITASAAFKSTLTSSHRSRARLGVWLPDEDGVYAFAGYVGLASGSLDITSDGSIRRQGNFTAASLDSLLEPEYITDFNSAEYLEALTSKSAEVTVEWGQILPDEINIEWVILARMRVEEATKDEVTATVDFSGYDTASRVTGYPLMTVYAPFDIDDNKLTCVEAIQDLVNAAFPSAAPPTWYVHPDIDSAVYPPDNTTFSGARDEAVNSLAKPINAKVGPNNEGVWEIWPAGLGDRTPVWHIKPGEPDGTLVAAKSTFSRRTQNNGIPISWESPDGTGGFVLIVDADPDSPTYWDGAFGKQPKDEESVDTITTEEQAIAYATTQLQAAKGIIRGISLEAVHNPLLVYDDIIGVWLTDGTAERRTVDTISLDIGGGTMSLDTRVVRGGITYDEFGVTYDDAGFTYDGQET